MTIKEVTEKLNEIYINCDDDCQVYVGDNDYPIDDIIFDKCNNSINILLKE